MAYTIENSTNSKGEYNGTRRVLRQDAVRYNNDWYCPTSEKTKWVATWEEFIAAGGQVGHNEDQTEITLRLPEPYKFSVRFNRTEA